MSYWSSTILEGGSTLMCFADTQIQLENSPNRMPSSGKGDILDKKESCINCFGLKVNTKVFL